MDDSGRIKMFNFAKTDLINNKLKVLHQPIIQVF
jgi:hypothetical protein